MSRGTGLDPSEDDAGCDDLPRTHLDDDEYEAFLERELDGDGGLRTPPKVGLIIFVLIVILLGAAVVAFGS